MQKGLCNWAMHMKLGVDKIEVERGTQSLSRNLCDRGLYVPGIKCDGNSGERWDVESSKRLGVLTQCHYSADFGEPRRETPAK